MIIEIDESTLGTKGKYFGKPISTTKIKVQCDVDGCEESWWTIWRYRKERDGDICQTHKNEMGICGMKGKKHSKETIAKFKDGRRAGENNVAKRLDVRKKISWALRGRDPYWLRKKKKDDSSETE
jgi:hypothetical protein